MASGLLSLKWNNHRSTFFHILATIRSKESYCDVTIACDGKFYPVHKLVLSTCSDYFEQMFERTNCKHPIIVLKDIRSQELEALLNYMYVGEVNVLQNELAGLIKAAECLMIKGLAVPDESPSKESKENKRTYVGTEDSPLSKRRKRDEETRPSPSQNQQIHRESRDSTANSQSQRQSSSASIPTPSPTVARAPPNPISPSPSAGSASESVSEDCSQAHSEVNEQPSLPNAQESVHRTVEQTSSQSQEAVPEVILDEPGVKEEPQEIEEEITDTKEIFESHHFEHPGEGDSMSDQGTAGGGGGPTGFESQMLASQPQSMEDLVAQAIPGSSGLQGNSLWEGEGSFPMEGFSGDGSRPPQMVSWGSVEGEVAQTSANSNLNQLHLGAHSLGDPVGPSGLMACMETTQCQDPIASHLVEQQEMPLTRDREGFHCFECEKVFPSKWKLKRHGRIHTGEKPFACSLCPYRASQKPVLQTHMRRHTGEKFYCPCCPFYCSQRITMRKHMSKYNHGSDC
ncbi:longitudinals lacking protein, isoforms H/M/V-like isoform X2 [Eriocheir sinensis]|uniref:longitudinals lacking protein, isoforms H/M/V-like isoform X2 n=1 Tax=Eriocheir sinensis TaxID=95602 RepID=UPI0021CA56FC|nr:longitudinals lacking protein, isoforms H/M/V-like isoform X2 [Eriocheir sinensis]